MENGFDVAIMREMMARQAADAGRIVMLCDAVAAREAELITLRAKLATPKNPDDGK